MAGPSGNRPDAVLGTAQWGSAYGIAGGGGVDATAARDVLATVAGYGVQTVDTARSYSGSEELLGSCLGDDPGWEIVTKLDARLGEDWGSTSEQAVVMSLRASLRALRRDRVDGLLIHRWKAIERCGHSIWDALRVAKESGEVGFIGASAASPEEAFDMLGNEHVEAVQVAASLFDRRLEDSGFFVRPEIRNKRIFVRSVFLQGAVFLGADRLPPHLSPLQPVLKRLADWCRERDLGIRDACLGYAAHLPGELVLGFDDAEQAKEDLIALRSVALDTTARNELRSLVGELPAEIVNPANWPT